MTRREAVTLASPWGDVVVTLNPGRITGEALLEAGRLAASVAKSGDPTAEALSMAAVFTFLADAMEAWDLTDDEGTPIPVTADTLAALPLTFTLWLMGAVQEAMAADPKASGTPADG